MKPFYRVLDFILYSNLFIGVSALALTFTNTLTVEGSIHLNRSSWFIFFATIFMYSFFKFRDKDEPVFENSKPNWVAKNKQLARNILLISFIATAGFFIMLSQKKIMVAVLAALTFIYAFVPIPFIASKLKLRDIGWVRTIFIGIVWSILTVAVPLANCHIENGMFVFLLLRRLLFIIGLTMVFEIKDMNDEGSHRIQTLPMLIGVTNTKLLAQLVLFTLMAIIAIQYFFFDISFFNMAGNNLSLLISILCIQPVNEETPEIWYYLVLDGMMILQFVLVYAASKFY